MENRYGERVPMQRYFSAVRNMEQTVMFPSLLQGVLLGDQNDAVEGNSDEKRASERDLYEYYTLLRSIKSMVENGPSPLHDTHLGSREEEAREKTDLEGLFQYHISGLYRVLTQLTSTANTVTSKYNEILGHISQKDISFRW